MNKTVTWYTSCYSRSPYHIRNIYYTFYNKSFKIGIIFNHQTYNVSTRIKSTLNSVQMLTADTSYPLRSIVIIIINNIMILLVITNQCFAMFCFVLILWLHKVILIRRNSKLFQTLNAYNTVYMLVWWTQRPTTS